MNNDLLAVFEYLERERGLDRETLIRAVEEALVIASRKTIERANDLRVEIDRKTFDIRAYAHLKVVDSVRIPHDEISLSEARRGKAATQLGDVVEMEVTPRDFGRIAAQTAKQTILQKIRQAEKDKVFEEFKDRPGDIVNGMVRRFEHSDVIVEIGRAEAIMPAAERVPTEEYQIGETVRALVREVRHVTHGPEIILSRSHPDFVKRLFELEVAEIADRTVEIKGIAREAGYRTKLAVASRDEKVDPVGACVGLRGMRVRNIVKELSGEKIDIIRWSNDIQTFVANALAPAKLTQLSIDESTRTVLVIVDSDQLSLAIGKKGQNARLTSKLTGWKIDISRKADDISFEEKVARAVSELAKIEGIGPQRAESLVQAGFLTVEGILAAEQGDLLQIDGFDEAIATEVQKVAAQAYEKEHGPVES